MLNEIGIKAQKASLQIARLDTELKNKILLDMSKELLNNQENILKANLLDIENSKDLKLSTALTDRLTLNEERIVGMSNGLKKIIPLNDPVGEVTSSWTTDDGLLINKVRASFGVIGVIYEARPNVTSDVSGLCLKSGNAVILRGSSYCLDSNKVILQTLQNALRKNQVDENAIQIMDNQLIPNETPGLEILPFVVDHFPVNSAFGFKISYKGRTVVISGDTINDGSVQKYSKDVDLLVHSAISIDLTERFREVAPLPQLDEILFDIQDYHTTIKEAGEIARDANVKHLLIYHSIPTPRNTLMERVFFRPIEGIFEDYTLSDDGTRVVMPVGNNEIVIDKIN